MSTIRVLLILLFMMMASLEASSHQPICLNMIVKNESAVIRRCLSSVKPLIDYWVIVDTGSTDGTQEIIRDFMKDIPGELYERPWRNFAENRNEALDLALGKGAYYLFMDADDYLEYKPGFQMPVLTSDLYALWRIIEGDSFLNTHLVRDGLPWRWKGVVHEYIDCGQEVTADMIEDVTYIVVDDGFSHKDPQKYFRYIDLLEESLKKDPGNFRDMISLAKSYMGAGLSDKGLSLYQKIVQQCPWQEEVFWALIEVGNILREKKGPLTGVVNSYYKAHRICPRRIEPCYYLAELFNSQGSFDLAYACIKSYESLSLPYKRGAIYNMDWMNEFGLLFELSICSFYVERYQECLEVCDRLLQVKKLPTDLRVHTEKNRLLCLQKLQQRDI